MDGNKLKLSELEKAFFELYAVIANKTFPDTMDYENKRYNPYELNSKEEFIKYVERDLKEFKKDILGGMIRKYRNYQEEAQKLKLLRELIKDE